MLQQFRAFVTSQKLFKASDRILLAVSGGLDSVVMTRLFAGCGYKFGIAHCNFGLRGHESDEDEKFVAGLAEKLGVPFHSKVFDTLAYAKKHGVSVQMAARELRYEWFEELRASDGFHVIATAHHLDDQAETFLINLIRGTGIAGLHGIIPKQGKLVRPMLFTGRNEIRDYATENKIAFREDSSNLEEKYIRNRIRKKVMPQLISINPAFLETLTREIAWLREYERAAGKELEWELQAILIRQKDRDVVDLKQLKLSPAPGLALWKILSSYGFNTSVVEDIAGSLEGESGREWFSPTHRVVSHRQELIVHRIMSAQGQDQVYIGTETKQVSQPVKLKLSVISKTELKAVPAGKEFASLDFDRLVFPLELRKWKPGDIFHPFGMNGRKKVSDFLIDEKVSLPEKDNTWVICSEGRIAWIVGHRIDHRFRITSRTRNVLMIRLKA